MKFTLKYLTEKVIPVLRKEHKTAEALKKAISAFLKQGDEEIPVVNEAGEPVEIEEIILVGAAPAEEGDDDGEDDGGEPAELNERSIQSIVTKSVEAAMTIHNKAAGRPKIVPIKARIHKAWATPFSKRTRVFFDADGKPCNEKAFGFAKFLQYSVFRDENAKRWLDERGIICLAADSVQKDMTGGVPSAGGVFVPVEFSSDIIRLIDQFGVFRQHGNVSPMATDVEVVPRVLAEGDAQWIGENTSFDATDDVNDSVELIAKELGKMMKINKALIADASISMADRAAESIAQKVSQAEDAAAFVGAGGSTHGGVHGFTVKLKDGLHTAGLILAPSGDTAFADIIIDTLHEMMGKVHPAAIQSGNAKWFISQMGFATCFSRLTAAQGGTDRVQTEDGPKLMFEGSPVVITNSMYNSVADSNGTVAILYGDMRLAATLGDREQVSIETSTERYFEERKVAILGVERVAINVHDIGDNTAAGPIVGLQLTT